MLLTLTDITGDTSCPITLDTDTFSSDDNLNSAQRCRPMVPRHKPNVVLLVAIFFSIAIVSDLSALTGSPPSSEQLSFHDDTWHASLSPYLWMAGMNGTVAFGGHEVRVDLSPR